MNARTIHAAVAALIAAPTVYAGHTAAITCASCTTIGTLQSTANTWVQTKATYVPATIVVTSLNAPITGIFHAHLACAKRCVIQVVPDASTTTNMQAAYMDGLMFARSSKHVILPIDTDLTPWALDSSVSLEVERAITYTNSSGTELWHLVDVVDPGWPSVTYYTYYEPNFKVDTNIFVGDVIQVNYPGGWSERFQFEGADNTPSHRWTRVPGTLMRFGKPYTGPSSAIGTPEPGATADSGTNTWSSGKVEFVLDANYCSGGASITVTAPDGSTKIGYGFAGFPC